MILEATLFYTLQDRTQREESLCRLDSDNFIF